MTIEDLRAAPLKIGVLLLVSFLGASTTSAQSPSDPLGVQKEAVELLLFAADGICQTVPAVESKTSFQLSGDAKATISKLLKRLADLGVSGAVKYQNEQTTGVLQEQLAETIAKSNDCKRDVLHTLKGMIPVVEPTGSHQRSRKQRSTITQTPTISNSASVNVNNGVVAPGATINVAPAPPPQAVPDVALRLVRAEEPVLVIDNTSNVVARDMKWSVALWNVDRPDVLPDRNFAIMATSFNWLRAHEEGGPIAVLPSLTPAGSPAPTPEKGNRLYGSAAVICADCSRGRTYVFYMKWGEGGWFAEVPNVIDGSLKVPLHVLEKGVPVNEDDVKAYVRFIEAVPITSRIPITEK